MTRQLTLQNGPFSVSIQNGRIRSFAADSGLFGGAKDPKTMLNFANMLRDLYFEVMKEIPEPEPKPGERTWDGL